MELDNSASANAQKAKLRAELAEINSELEEKEYEHSVEQNKNALSQQFEDYQSAREEEIEALKSSLDNQEKLISDSFETVKQNASTVGQQISAIAKKHGVQVSKSLTSSWQAGENAIASYGTTLSTQSSAFIGNIVDVENEVWNLQSQANETASTLAYMFSTQADNLVSELSQSYYAESNLNTMTNALQSSLVNALERGYNISGITSALDSIADSANKAKTAIDELNNTDTSSKAMSAVTYTYQYNGAIQNRKRMVDVYASNGNYITSVSEDEAKSAYKATLKVYAKGGLVTKDANNPLNGIAKAVGEDAIIAAKEGESVLTVKQTELLQKFSEILDSSKIVENFKPLYTMPNFTSNLKSPEIISRSTSQPINIQNSITFTGTVNDANNFAKQIASIADKQVTKSWKEFTGELYK